MKLTMCCRYCGNWTARDNDLVGEVAYPVCPVCKWFVYGSAATCLEARASHVWDRLQSEMRRAQSGKSVRFGADLLSYKARRVRYRIDGGDIAVRCKGECCRSVSAPVGQPGVAGFNGFTKN